MNPYNQYQYANPRNPASMTAPVLGTGAQQRPCFQDVEVSVRQILPDVKLMPNGNPNSIFYPNLDTIRILKRREADAKTGQDAVRVAAFTDMVRGREMLLKVHGPYNAEFDLFEPETDGYELTNKHFGSKQAHERFVPYCHGLFYFDKTELAAMGTNVGGSAMYKLMQKLDIPYDPNSYKTWRALLLDFVDGISMEVATDRGILTAQHADDAKKGIEEIHNAFVWHRDLWPQNCIVRNKAPYAVWCDLERAVPASGINLKIEEDTAKRQIVSEQAKSMEVRAKAQRQGQPASLTGSSNSNTYGTGIVSYGSNMPSGSYRR